MMAGSGSQFTRCNLLLLPKAIGPAVATCMMRRPCLGKFESSIRHLVQAVSQLG